MPLLLRATRSLLLLLLGLGVWLGGEQAAQAQVLLAQAGGAKTAIGYVLFLLAVFLGLLVVCRPSGRQWLYTEQELREQQARKQGQLRP